jgi:hypothetical protein
MSEMKYILALFLMEIIIFITEVILSVFNKKNQKLKKASSLEDIDFIDLTEGYRTSISFFRVSIFICYLVLIFLYLDVSKENSFEKFVMISVVGILLYLVSLHNIKTFVFYTDYFIVTAPFNFFKKDTLVNYNSIRDFKLYRALYSSYFLKLDLNNQKTQTIQFSGSFIPKNELAIRIILNAKTGLKKDLINRKFHIPKER